VTRVILPDKNEKDHEDVSDNVKKALTFQFVQDIDQVLELTFGEALKERVRNKPQVVEPAKADSVVTVVNVEDPLSDESEGDLPIVHAQG
jgi:hypothetical protein